MTSHHTTGMEPETQCPTDGAILDHPIRLIGPVHRVTVTREDTGEVGTFWMPVHIDIDDTSCAPYIRNLWPDMPDIDPDSWRIVRETP